MIIYSTSCPKCKILEKKLNDKGIQYTVENDVNKIMAHGIFAVPVLEMDDGTQLQFGDAVNWVNHLEATE